MTTSNIARTRCNSIYITSLLRPAEWEHIEENLTPTQQKDLWVLEDVFRHVFLSVSGQTLLRHEIKIPPGVIILLQHYWVPEACHQAVAEEVTQMFHDGIIEESNSPLHSSTQA